MIDINKSINEEIEKVKNKNKIIQPLYTKYEGKKAESETHTQYLKN